MPTTKSTKQNSTGFSDFEREAIQNRAKELLAESKASAKKEIGMTDVVKAIADMPEPDKSMAKKIHEIIMETAPNLWPRTWYGMPAYAKGKDDPVLCFFQGAYKFKARYGTLGFNGAAKLDDGNMWPAAFAITKLTAADEKKIAELIKKAVS